MQTSVSSKLKKCHRVHFVHFSPSLIFRTLNVYNRSTFSRAEGIILVILFIFSINSCTNRKNVSSATHILIILISFSPFYIIIFNAFTCTFKIHFLSLQIFISNILMSLWKNNEHITLIGFTTECFIITECCVVYYAMKRF